MPSSKISNKSRSISKQKDFSKRYVSIVKYAAVVAVFLWIATILYYELRKYLAHQQSNESIKTNEPAIYKDKKWSSIPSFDEYESVAQFEGWLPTSPEERLYVTLQKYPKVFDILKDSKDDPITYIKALDEEMAFLLKVLSKTSSDKSRKSSSTREFDLSPLLLKSIEVANQVLYRVMKHRLHESGSAAVVTKETISRAVRHWLFSPVVSLLTFPASPSTRIDVTYKDPVTLHSPLVSVVQLRLYALLPVLFKTHAQAMLDDLEAALRAAIRNRDDLALALLLKLRRETPASSTSPASLSLVSLAQEARSAPVLAPHIAQRLLFEHCRQLADHALDEACVGLSYDEPALHSDFLATASTPLSAVCDASSSIGSSTSTDSGDSDETKSLLNGNQAEQDSCSNNKDVTDVGPREEGSAEIAEPFCAIDTLTWQEAAGEHGFWKYVQNNLPVRILLPATTVPIDKKWWLRHSLRSDHGAVEVVVGDIPYASLFGHNERLMSLSSYLDYIDRYSSANHSTPSAPLYLFSDDQMEITKALKPRILDFLHGKGWVQDATRRNVTLFTLLSYLTSPYPPSPHNATTSVPTPQFRTQFFLGSTGSGAPLHSHGPAINVVLGDDDAEASAGQVVKEWLLLPPSRDMYSHTPPLAWRQQRLSFGKEANPYYDSNSHTAGLCRVHQRAGEVLFVPRHYTHSVLNVQRNGAMSVGFAVEVMNYVL